MQRVAAVVETSFLGLDQGEVAAAGFNLPLNYFDDLKQPLDGALLIEGDDLSFVLR